MTRKTLLLCALSLVSLSIAPAAHAEGTEPWRTALEAGGFLSTSGGTALLFVDAKDGNGAELGVGTGLAAVGLTAIVLSVALPHSHEHAVALSPAVSLSSPRRGPEPVAPPTEAPGLTVTARW